jgi:hypothetical protein
MRILQTVSYMSPLHLQFLLFMNNKVLFCIFRIEIQRIITFVFSQSNGTRGRKLVTIRNSGCVITVQSIYIGDGHSSNEADSFIILGKTYTSQPLD